MNFIIGLIAIGAPIAIIATIAYLVIKYDKVETFHEYMTYFILIAAFLMVAFFAYIMINGIGEIINSNFLHIGV